MISYLRRYPFLVIALVAIIILGLLLILNETGNKKKAMPSPRPTITTEPAQTNLLPTDIQKQEEADRNFANELKKIQTTYPWYSKFPLSNSNYFVYFDLEKKQLIAKIYSLSNNLSADQVNSIKNEITSKLLGLEIPINQFPIVWQAGF